MPPFAKLCDDEIKIIQFRLFLASDSKYHESILIIVKCTLNAELCIVLCASCNSAIRTSLLDYMYFLESIED